MKNFVKPNGEIVILAKTIKGQEFCYASTSAHRVFPNAADRICEMLNKINYKLKAGECWYKYEIDQYDHAPYVYSETQNFRLTKTRLIERY